MRLCKVCSQPLPKNAYRNRKYHKHCGDLVEREQKRQSSAKRMAKIYADPEAHEAHRERDRQSKAKCKAEIKADPEAYEAFLEQKRQSNVKYRAKINADLETREASREQARQRNAKRMAEIYADPKAHEAYLEQARRHYATKAQQEEYLRYIAFLAAIKKLEEREGLGGDISDKQEN